MHRHHVEEDWRFFSSYYTLGRYYSKPDIKYRSRSKNCAVNFVYFGPSLTNKDEAHCRSQFALRYANPVITGEKNLTINYLSEYFQASIGFWRSLTNRHRSIKNNIRNCNIWKHFSFSDIHNIPTRHGISRNVKIFTFDWGLSLGMIITALRGSLLVLITLTQ